MTDDGKDGEGCKSKIDNGKDGERCKEQDRR